VKTARLINGQVTVVDRTVDDPGEDHALVRIAAAGVCHSDLHLARGDWAGVGVDGERPLGHEAIGVVEALGPGAERWVSVGDRVILGLGGTGGGFWCGACEYCLSGRPRHCARSTGIMGVFAEQFVVYAPGLVIVPESLSDLEAPLACGGLTAYGAVKKLTAHGVQPGSTIAVVGAAGGLGHYAVQLLHAFGYRVVGVDIGDERLEFIRSLGAEVATTPDDAAAAVADSFGGVHASLVFSARIAGYQLGLELLRKGGLFVAVGLPASSDGNMQLNPFDLLLRDPTIIFSAVGTVQDMRELVDLAARGEVHSHVSRTGPLSELDAIFDELAGARYLGRAVITDLSR
jgi:alcohol dehydrogenase, propanol-preferring